MISKRKSLTNSGANLQQKYMPLILGIGVLLLFLVPQLGLSSYWMNNLIKVGVYSIMALGLNILVGYTGLVSLGQAGFVAIGAYATTIFVKDFHMNFFLAMLIGVAISAFAGLLLGLPSMRVRDTYLTIITLGFGEIMKTVIIVWDKVTNGPLGIRNIPAPVLFGKQLSMYNGGLYYLVLVAVILISVFCAFLYKSNTGRSLRALKDDEKASTMMGINAFKYKVLAFVLSAAICGIGGALLSTQLGYIDQNTFTFDMSTLILSIVILGGMGTLRGMFLGSLILIIFPELARFLVDYRFVIYGLVLIVMMRFRPQGILGWRAKKPIKVPEEMIKTVQDSPKEKLGISDLRGRGE